MTSQMFFLLAMNLSTIGRQFRQFFDNLSGTQRALLKFLIEEAKIIL